MINEMILAKIGLDADAPSTNMYSLSLRINRFTPCAETSGNPLPDALYNPEYVLPRVDRYFVTPADWYEGTGKKLENPPEENEAGPLLSPKSELAPTEVT